MIRFEHTPLRPYPATLLLACLAICLISAGPDGKLQKKKTDKKDPKKATASKRKTGPRPAGKPSVLVSADGSAPLKRKKPAAE